MAKPVNTAAAPTTRKPNAVAPVASTTAGIAQQLMPVVQNPVPVAVNTAGSSNVSQPSVGTVATTSVAAAAKSIPAATTQVSPVNPNPVSIQAKPAAASGVAPVVPTANAAHVPSPSHPTPATQAVVPNAAPTSEVSGPTKTDPVANANVPPASSQAVAPAPPSTNAIPVTIANTASVAPSTAVPPATTATAQINVPAAGVTLPVAEKLVKVEETTTSATGEIHGSTPLEESGLASHKAVTHPGASVAVKLEENSTGATQPSTTQAISAQTQTIGQESQETPATTPIRPDVNCATEDIPKTPKEPIKSC